MTYIKIEIKIENGELILKLFFYFYQILYYLTFILLLF